MSCYKDLTSYPQRIARVVTKDVDAGSVVIGVPARRKQVGILALLNIIYFHLIIIVYKLLTHGNVVEICRTINHPYFTKSSSHN